MAVPEEQDIVRPEPLEARGSGRRSLFWAVWLWSALFFLFLILATLATFFDRFPGDERMTDALQGVNVPAFGGFLGFVNLLGDTWFYIPITLGLSGWFFLSRGSGEGALMLLTFVPRGLNSLVKGWVERPRPSTELIDVTQDAAGSSFPSGHAVGTAAVFLALFFLIPVVVSSRPLRWTLQAGCLLVALAAGPARVYVGVHWPSDVLGGYLLALLCLAPLLTVYFLVRGRPAIESGG